MTTELYYQYNPWWEDSETLKEVFPRPFFEARLHAALNNKSVVFLTGLRRVGKTTLMKMLIHHLLNKGVPSTHIFYISLDDFLLKNHSIVDVLAEYRKLHRLTHQAEIYVFFDEITYKEDFRLQLKNIYDQQNVKIFASSSSSSAFRDKKGLLTGREQIIEITPLSFDEFLLFKNVEIKKRDAILEESYFEEYLQTGGIPEYVLYRDREYLTSLVEDILYKDIVGFYNVKDPNLIKDYFVLLMERAGKQISLNKVANILGISPDSAKRYLRMFEETYLIHLVPRYGKTNETLLATKKVYAADLGIRNLFTGFRDTGAVFENLVFSVIKPLKPRYVYKEGTEIDFFTQNKWLIEAKYGQVLNPKQEQLFNEFTAAKKFIIKDFADVRKLESLVKEGL